MKDMILDNKRKPGHPCGRAAAWIATVAVCACTAVRLDAVVIDDFEGPVKWDKGGGGTNYFVWGLTNGQLVVHTNPPIPTPPGSPLKTYDNIYWPNSMPGVSLEGGRTLELRMDLNYTSADDLFLVLMCGGSNWGADACYMAIVDRNEVVLMKYCYLGTTTFYWDVLATTNDNVTVKLALAKTNSSLAITVEVVDKGNQRATLYERTFLDGPGQDGTVPPPDPHGVGPFFGDADPGGPFTNFTYAAVGCWQLIFTTPPPLEMLLDNLEYDVYHPPHLEIAPVTNGVDLTWLLPLEEHIVVAADQLTGPWCPCWQPYTRTTNDVFCLTMPCDSPQKFFKLTPGRQFTDDFSSPLPSYMDWFRDPGEDWFVTNGVLTMSAIQGSQGYNLLILPLGTNAAASLRDFYMSVDLLDWVTSTTNWTCFSLVGRAVLYSPNWGNGYIGELILNADGLAGKAMLSIWDGDLDVRGMSFDTAAIPPPYRLEFSGVGSHLTLRVLNRTTREVIAEQSLVRTTFADGLVGVHTTMRSDPDDAYTITADNFFVSGTKP